MFYDPNQAFDNRSLRNAAPHIYKKAAEICAGEDEHSDEGKTCGGCSGTFDVEQIDGDGYCRKCADWEENQ